MDSQEQIKEQLRRASWATDVSEQVRILEKAIPMAEFHNDFDLIVQTKIEYIKAVNNEGYHEKAFSHLAWLLAQIDNNPEKVGQHNQFTILWIYKWIILGLPAYSNIPLAKIVEAFEDMEKRYIAFDNNNLNIIYYFKRNLYLSLGNLSEAKKYHDLYRENKKLPFKLSSTMFEDCGACAVNSDLRFYFAISDLDKAIEIGLDIIQSNRRCTHVPKSTYASLCLIYTLKEDFDTAENYYMLGRNAYPFDQNHLDFWSKYIHFLAKVKKFNQAIDIFNKSFQHLVKTLSHGDIFIYSAKVFLLFSCYRKHHPRKKLVKLNIEENNIIYAEDGKYEIDKLIEIFEQKALKYGQMLDLRNQNFSNLDYMEKIKMQLS